MRELRKRHPDLSDAERQKLLGWVLQWLSDAVANEQKHWGAGNDPKASDTTAGAFF
jgi:hypothetical protein